MRWLPRLFSSKTTNVFTPPCVPTDAQIEEAEAKLGIQLPPSFLAFLRRTDDLVVGPCASFLWVGADAEGHHNLADVNRPESREWTGLNPFTSKVESTVMWELPEYLVAFFSDGMGNYVCFDTRRPDERGEYPIVFWDHEIPADENIAAADRRAEFRESRGIVARSFEEWLEAELAAHESSGRR